MNWITRYPNAGHPFQIFNNLLGGLEMKKVKTWLVEFFKDLAELKRRELESLNSRHD